MNVSESNEFNLKRVLDIIRTYSLYKYVYRKEKNFT